MKNYQNNPVNRDKNMRTSESHMWGIFLPSGTEVQYMLCVAEHINKMTIFTTLIRRNIF